MYYDPSNDNPPPPPYNAWTTLRTIWAIIIVIVSLMLIYLTWWLVQKCQTPADPSHSYATAIDFERNVGDGSVFELHGPRREALRPESIVSTAAPQYETHMKDKPFQNNMQLERKGKYLEVAKGEEPPKYRGPE